MHLFNWSLESVSKGFGKYIDWFGRLTNIKKLINNNVKEVTLAEDHFQIISRKFTQQSNDITPRETAKDTSDSAVLSYDVKYKSSWQYNFFFKRRNK